MQWEGIGNGRGRGGSAEPEGIDVLAQGLQKGAYAR
jgi:hypothetical protein